MWQMKGLVVSLLFAQLSQCFAVEQQPLDAASSNKRLLTDDLIAFHKSITEIESITYNEEAVGNWLAESLERQGYTVEKQTVDKDPVRFNIYAYPGKTRETKVLVSSHIDTVPPFYPYKHSNKTIHGRGSVDDKASLAAQVIAVNNLISNSSISADEVALLFVVGEEVGGDGMRVANDLDLKPQAVVFGEPTEGKLVSGHKGNLGLKIKAYGKAAHSGYPWLGRSANEVLTRALAALMELGPNLPKSDKYGVTTINLGQIEGGVAANVVAESASANIAIRIAEGTPEMIKAEIKKAVYIAMESFLDDELKAEDIIDLQFGSAGYGPIEIDHDIPGFESMTVNYGTDIPWLKRTVEGQKRYLYGPGSILVAHSDHEALSEEQLFDGLEGYERILLHILGDK